MSDVATTTMRVHIYTNHPFRRSHVSRLGFHARERTLDT